MNFIAVDDERPALNVLQRAIETAAGTVPACFDAAEAALDYARQHPVDVAFLDIEMDGMGGLVLAKRLKDIQPDLNVIFVTGYSHYALGAIQMRASGYVMKPINPGHVEEELRHLRQPPQRRDEGVRVQCFGNFEVFMDGTPIAFGRPKAKEALAYLVDRRGAGVSKKELAALLWEDKPYNHSLQSHLYILISDIERALKRAGAPEILIQRRGLYGVDVTKFRCDYYDFERGDPVAVNQYRGEYMANYSWAEFTAGFLTGRRSGINP